MTALPAIPGADAAKLPAAYREATKALSACSRLDECQHWADKAAALASYARQAKDDTLIKLSTRIQARAIRRAGELLKLVEPARGANQNIREGDHPKDTRESVATAAGMSEHQRKTALRVASVPEADFEAAIESDAPPTVTALAEMGVQRRDVAPAIDLAPLHKFANFCGRVDPIEAAKRNAQVDLGHLRALVGEIDSWLDRFVTHLGHKED